METIRVPNKMFLKEEQKEKWKEQMKRERRAMEPERRNLPGLATRSLRRALDFKPVTQEELRARDANRWMDIPVYKP